jgi:hypothetical protein
MALTQDQKDAFFEHHLPHRLCLLTTFRDRQSWFTERIGREDCDLLRASKDSALIAIRMFAEFLGLKNGSRRDPKPDDVFVEMLGCDRVELAGLPRDEREVIAVLTLRSNKELAHLTTTYADQIKFNNAEIIVKGINIIERLLREKVYALAKDRNGQPYPFPTLEQQKMIYGHECELVGGYRLTPPTE